MTIELILQILVFPILGWVLTKLYTIEAKLAAHQERFRAVEHRITQLEKTV